MDSINTILAQRKIVVDEGRVNNKFEQANEFLDYLSIPHSVKDVIFVLKLFKKFGPEKVLQIRSWLKDYSNLDVKRWKGLVMWKLKYDLAPKA